LQTRKNTTLEIAHKLVETQSIQEWFKKCFENEKAYPTAPLGSTRIRFWFEWKNWSKINAYIRAELSGRCKHTNSGTTFQIWKSKTVIVTQCRWRKHRNVRSMDNCIKFQ